MRRESDCFEELGSFPLDVVRGGRVSACADLKFGFVFRGRGLSIRVRRASGECRGFVRREKATFFVADVGFFGVDGRRCFSG